MSDDWRSRPRWTWTLAQQAEYDIEHPPLHSRNDPLTDEEVAELRRRLDGPGGHRLGLSLRERTARRRQLPAVIRTTERVQQLQRQVNRESVDSRAGGRAYAEGILAAIAWAGGHRPDGPVTGKLADDVPPTYAAIREEQVAACEVQERTRSSRHAMDYVTGVEATLGWLIALTDEPPWD